MERAGLPTVSVVADEFARLALMKRNSLGLPEFEPVFFSYASSRRLHSAAEARELAESAFDRVVEVLTGGRKAP
jgi:hypothetical protein